MILLQLFIVFFRIGFFCFGGGYAMLPLIYQGIQDFGFMGTEEFARLVALSQVTPGPIAVNAATYVGYQSAGVMGAVFATIGMSLPSIILVVLVMKFMMKFHENKGVKAVFSGIRPATIGLLASAIIFLAEGALFKSGGFTVVMLQAPAEYFNLIPILFCVVAAFLNGKFKMGPIKIMLIAGVAGAFLIR